MGATRNDQLDQIRAIRDGRTPKRKLDCGEVVMSMPEQDFYALCRLYPELNSKDAAEQTAAWEKFLQSPFAEPYRVVRTANQVQRSIKRILNP